MIKLLTTCLAPAKGRTRKRDIDAAIGIVVSVGSGLLLWAAILILITRP